MLNLTGITHLEQRLKEVEAVGGEGLMLRAPNSFYETKRSQTLLKVKSTLEAEARVIAHQPSESSMPRSNNSLNCVSFTQLSLQLLG